MSSATLLSSFLSSLTLQRMIENISAKPCTPIFQPNTLLILSLFSGGQTFTVPPASQTTILSAGSVSVSFQPGATTAPSGSGSGGGRGGGVGGGGLGGLFSALEGLQPAANGLSVLFNTLSSAGSSWASGKLSDADFLNVLRGVLDDTISGTCVHNG
jgi:hypothetical protein